VHNGVANVVMYRALAWLCKRNAIHVVLSTCLLSLLLLLLLLQDELKAASKQLADAKAQLAVAKAGVSLQSI
jgi:hypothetical protein